MTSPEDDSLEEALRRALSEAASEVEAGSDGLDKIRAKIGGRPPRPWLTSVLFGIVERARNWIWHGHWAWPARMSRLREVRWSRLRRGNFPGSATGSLRLAAVLAALAVIASILLGVQPLRDAIFQASAPLNGGGKTQRAAVGTDGHGARTAAGHGTPSSGSATPGGSRTGPGSTPSAARTPGAAASKCATSAPPVAASARPSVANVRSSATRIPTPVVSTGVTSAEPTYTDTSVTCSVTPPAKSATPAPPAGSSLSAAGSATAAPAPATASTSPAPWPSTPATDLALSGDGWPAQPGPLSWFPQGRRPRGSWPQRGYGSWSGHGRWR